MATSTGRDGKSLSISDMDVLLHPELLSQDFIQLILREKNVTTIDCENRDLLTDLYLRHVIPLPQRSLPNSRWGKKMERSRGRETTGGHSSSNDQSRKRPLIVYDGSSSHAGMLKVKKPEGPSSTTSSTGSTERLKPPPPANFSNPIRRLSGSTSSTASSSLHHSNSSLKREANGSNAIKSPEVKKKIQHVTWP